MFRRNISLILLTAVFLSFLLFQSDSPGCIRIGPDGIIVEKEGDC